MSDRWTMRACLHGHGLHQPHELNCLTCWTVLSEPFEVMRVSPADENGIGLVSQNHGDTAHDAALRVRPRSGTQRSRILALVENWGGLGRTRDEIAETLGMDPNTVRPRVRELVRGGHVYVSAKQTRRTKHGRDSEVLISIGFPDG